MRWNSLVRNVSILFFLILFFSFDKPSSLAAFLRPDPEELLYSLGFCNQNTLLQSIPERFFHSQSEAYGIDVAGIHNSLLLEDQKVFNIFFFHFLVRDVVFSF